MPQLTYTEAEERGAPGLIAKCGHGHGKSLANEDAATIPFGKAVKLGTNLEEQFALVDGAAGEVFAGILSCQFVQQDYDAVGAAQYEVAKILRHGEIWVTVQSAVQPGDPVFYLNTGVNAGDFGSAGDVDISANAAWCSVAGVGELAKLEINLP